ncbi:MAG: hypothetical protein ACLGIJ_05595 [Candidatus Limnocylindria bacterium]
MHQGLEDGAWERMTPLEQMGNLGTEVGRAARAKEAGDTTRGQGAFDRALELFELTIVDERWRGPRRRELCLMRELFIDFIVGDNEYGESAASLDRYFLPFAIAARLEYEARSAS